jgi:hypothetical protein
MYFVHENFACTTFVLTVSPLDMKHNIKIFLSVLSFSFLFYVSFSNPRVQHETQAYIHALHIFVL